MSETRAEDAGDPQSRIRHRVANTFHFLAALARMRAQRGDDPTPEHGLLWMADTIVDLGSLERFVRNDQADISAYLATMVTVWQDRHKRHRLQVVLEACPLTLHEALAPSFVLAVLELVSNAASHTFLGDAPPEVRLTLTARDAGYVLAVSDTGFSMASPKDTFGLWLARRLARQIKGDLILEPDGGAILTCRP